MSNLDPEKEYSDLTEVIDLAFEQLMLKLFVSVPGIIDSYDAATKRAVVIPAIRILKTDDTTEDQEPVVNVPVLWPSGGGFTMLFPLESGDAVNIFFSQRGITKFKETFGMSDPDENLFDKEDAHIMAGFGALSVTPAKADSACFQDEAGLNSVVIDKTGNIEIEAVTSITGTAPVINLIGNVIITGTLTVSGSIFGTAGAAAIMTAGATIAGIPFITHAHGGVDTGSGVSGGPQ